MDTYNFWIVGVHFLRQLNIVYEYYLQSVPLIDALDDARKSSTDKQKNPVKVFGNIYKQYPTTRVWLCTFYYGKMIAMRDKWPANEPSAIRAVITEYKDRCDKDTGAMKHEYHQ